MKKLFWSIVGVLLALVLLRLVFFGLCIWFENHEPARWARAYDDIQIGMTLDSVEKIIESIHPAKKSRYEEGKLQNTEFRKKAKFYIYYRARRPNLWQYEIYFDKEGKVFNKVRWYD